MFICFFSLVASMFCNIHVSQKEIAILRALGMTCCQLCRSYVYEAFIVVLSSSLLGISIGSVLAYTMALQQSLFLRLPSRFYVPVELGIVVLITSIVSALAATLVPLTRVL